MKYIVASVIGFVAVVLSVVVQKLLFGTTVPALSVFLGLVTGLHIRYEILDR